MTSLEIFLAYGADLIFGDPPKFPHPVKLIGRAIHFLENRLTPWKLSPAKQRFFGVILVLVIVGGTGALIWIILLFSQWFHPILSSFLSIFFAYTTLSTRSLYDEAKKVLISLQQGNLVRARQEIGFLVSRETNHLEEREICRALIETVSENTSDGIVAPLFYLVIGGPIAAMAYKAINTLDSMVGYKNDRYRYFGWASARVDDLANLIPARLTAFLFILSSLLIKEDWKNAWKVVWRDGSKNISPNSGYPEAAIAGALGIQLGGENIYFGKSEKKPLIGIPKSTVTLIEAKKSLHLMVSTSLIAGILSILIAHFR